MNSLNKILVVLLLFLFTSLSAQEVPLKEATPVKKPIANRQQNNRNIQHARQLLNQKKYDVASAFLEDLYQKDQNNQIVVSLLVQCYQGLDLPLKQQELMRRQLELYPENFNYNIFYSEAAARLGNLDEALKRYERTFQLKVAGVNSHLIISSMLRNDMNRQASEIISNLRELNKDSLLLAIQMGTIFEREKEYTKAAAEYTKLLNDSTTRGKEAVVKIRQLLAFEESAKATEEYLIENGGHISNEQILSLLTFHYLNSKRYETAYAQTIRHDSINGFKGMVPISFMSRCYNLKLYQLVVKVGDYLSERYPDNLGVIITSANYYGNACYELNQLDKAETIFRNLFNKSRSVRDKGTALNRIGEIYLKGRHKFAQARTLFDSVKIYYPQGAGHQKAIVNAPSCYLYQGKFEKAIIGYRSVNQKIITEEIKEEIAYTLGLLHLLNKQPDSAKTYFNKLIVDYPSGYFVNDALRHLLILDEVADSPELIYDYSSLIFFRKLEKTDSVLTVLETIAANPSGIIADMALLQLAKEYSIQNDTAKTLSYIERINSSFSDSYYLPEALKMKADILQANPATKTEGIELYRLLLEKYPYSTFNEEIREKLRRLSQLESA